MNILHLGNMIRPQEVTNEEEQEPTERRERSVRERQQENIRRRGARKEGKKEAWTYEYKKDRITISQEAYHAYQLAKELVTNSHTGEEVIFIAESIKEKDENKNNDMLLKIKRYIRKVFQQKSSEGSIK
jgi:alkaline phosphatase